MDRLALHLSQKLADDTDGFHEITTGTCGIELHFKLGGDEVTEVFDDICVDCRHHRLGVMAPSVTHIVEALELKAEGIEAHDLCGVEPSHD